MTRKVLFLGLAFAGVLIVAKRAKMIITGAYDSAIQTMAGAIKDFEGWYPGSRSYRNNNPGNLKYAGQLGATGADDTGHAIFSSYDAGWNALVRQLQLAFYGGSFVYSLTDTLYSFFSKYAEGNSRQYAQFVAGKLGVSPDTKLQTLGG